MSNTTKSYVPFFSILIFTLSMFVITGCGQEETTEEATSQQEVTNQIAIQQEPEQNPTAELDEEKIKAEAYEKAKAELEAKMKAEAAAKAKADAKRKAEADAKAKAEAEAKKKAEAEAKKKAETEMNEKAKREMEEKMKAIEAAKKKAEAEANKKAIEEAKKKAENLPKPKPGGSSAAATSSVVGLDGRTLKSKPNQPNSTGVSGNIVVNICINQEGYVLEANYVQKGSTIIDAAIIKEVIANTKKWKFIDSATAPAKECGVVTYQFK